MVSFAALLCRIDPQTLREWEKSFDRLLRSPGEAGAAQRARGRLVSVVCEVHK